MTALRVRTETLAVLAARQAPPVALALAANRVLDLVVEQAASGGDPAVAALRRLEHLEREVWLRSRAGQRDAAKAAARDVAATWQEMRLLAPAGDSLVERTL